MHSRLTFFMFTCVSMQVGFRAPHWSSRGTTHGAYLLRKVLGCLGLDLRDELLVGVLEAEILRQRGALSSQQHTIDGQLHKRFVHATCLHSTPLRMTPQPTSTHAGNHSP